MWGLILLNIFYIFSNSGMPKLTLTTRIRLLKDFAAITLKVQICIHHNIRHV